MTTLPTLPDFEDMFSTIQKIKELTFNKLSLEVQLKDAVSTITKSAYTNSKHFSNGKPRPMSFIEKAWLFSGFDGELLSLRQSYAEVCANLKHIELKFDLDKALIDVWRTESANKRLAVG